MNPFEGGTRSPLPCFCTRKSVTQISIIIFRDSFRCNCPPDCPLINEIRPRSFTRMLRCDELRCGLFFVLFGKTLQNVVVVVRMKKKMGMWKRKEEENKLGEGLHSASPTFLFNIVQLCVNGWKSLMHCCLEGFYAECHLFHSLKRDHMMTTQTMMMMIERR